jgi:lipopolysaccharide export LptBFGC system permease protein LptF
MPAPRILWRYVLRDVAVYTLIALIALTLLLVVQNVLRFIDELAMAGVSLDALVQLSAIILPSYVAYAIPSACSRSESSQPAPPATSSSRSSPRATGT